MNFILNFLASAKLAQARLCTRLNENGEFLSSFSRLGIVLNKFGSALGLTKTVDFTSPTNFFSGIQRKKYVFLMFYDDKKPSETNPDGFKTHILSP